MQTEIEIVKMLKPHVKGMLNLEIPPNPEMGDYAFPCFILAKKFKKNPVNIAEDLARSIKLKLPIESIEAKGPYLNFFINKQDIASSVIKDILKEKEGVLQ